MTEENLLLTLSGSAISQIDLLLERKSQLVETIRNLQEFTRTAAEIDPLDSDWNHAFFEAWANLEITYAIAAAEGRAQLSVEEVGFVEDTCLEMRRMLQEKMARLYSYTPDNNKSDDGHSAG